MSLNPNLPPSPSDRPVFPTRLKLVDNGSSAAGYGSHHFMAVSTCPRYAGLGELQRDLGEPRPPRRSFHYWVTGSLLDIGLSHYLIHRYGHSEYGVHAGTMRRDFPNGNELLFPRLNPGEHYDWRDAIDVLAEKTEFEEPMERGAWIPHCPKAKEIVQDVIGSGIMSSYRTLGVQMEHHKLISADEIPDEYRKLHPWLIQWAEEQQHEAADPGLYTIPYAARIDWVVEGDDGLVYFLDYKSSARRFDAKTAESYRLSFQMVGHYILGRHVYGERFGGVGLVCIQKDKPKTKDRQMEISLLNEPVKAVQSFASDLFYWEGVKRHMRASGVPPELWPRASNTGACAGKYQICPHLARHCDGEILDIEFDIGGEED